MFFFHSATLASRIIIMSSSLSGYIPKSTHLGFITGIAPAGGLPTMCAAAARNTTAGLTNQEVADDVKKGIVTSTTAAAVVLTLGTSTSAIVIDLGSPPVGTSFNVKYMNSGSFPLTLTQADSSTTFTSSAGAAASSFVVQPGRSAESLWVIGSSSSIAVYVVHGGGAPSVAPVLTGTTVLTAAQSGTTYVLNNGSGGGATITLPTAAVGLNFKFYLGAVPSSDWIISGGSLALRGVWCAPTSNVTATTGSPQLSFVHTATQIGDHAQFFCPDTVHWSVQAWTRVDGGFSF
jgi:hypothetical protein